MSQDRTESIVSVCACVTDVYSYQVKSSSQGPAFDIVLIVYNKG